MNAKTNEPDPVDVFVGTQMRLLRKQRELSQTALAQGLGLTFQQIQKYERGANRVSASMLYKAAGLLGVPVAQFFEGLEGQDAAAVTGNMALIETFAQPKIQRLAMSARKMPPDQLDAFLGLVEVVVGDRAR